MGNRTHFHLDQPEKIIALMAVLHPSLTRKESLCLFWACLSLTKTEISLRIGITENTVKSHLKSVHKKLNVSSLSELKNSFVASVILLNMFR